MALNIRYFFIVLLFITIVASIFLKPFSSVKIKRENLPQVTFSSFKSFEITENGVESMGVGKEAYKYDKKIIIKSPDFMRRTANGIEKLSANNGIIVENSYVRLYGFAKLSRDDNLTIKSSKMIYNIKKSFYSTEGDKFVAYYGKNIMTGESLKYYQKSGKIFADNIYAKIFEEDR